MRGLQSDVNEGMQGSAICSICVLMCFRLGMWSLYCMWYAINRGSICHSSKEIQQQSLLLFSSTLHSAGWNPAS